jgi:putative ABC transport system permease protein
LQDLNGSQGKASAFYAKLDNPENATAVVDEIKNVPGMGTYVVRAMKEWLQLMTPDNTPGLSSFIRVVVGISMIIGFMVIFQAMYTAVMERTREIGILKSIGASKFYIMNVILRESTLLSICGIIVGVGFSELARLVILRRFFPSLPIEISGGWIARAMIIAVIGALLGAIYPAMKAARKDPIEALAYE